MMLNERRRNPNARSAIIALVVTTYYHHNYAIAFSPSTHIIRTQYRNNNSQASYLKRISSSYKASLIEEDEVTNTKTVTTSNELHHGSNTAEIATLNNNDSHAEVNENWIVKNLKEKMGKVDENRMAIPEFANGEIDRIFR